LSPGPDKRDRAIERRVTQPHVITVVQDDPIDLNPGMSFKPPGYFPGPDLKFILNSPPAQQPPQREGSLQAIGRENPMPDR